MTALVAELVPRLKHAGPVIQAVVCKRLKLDVQGAVLGDERIGVIPLYSVSI